MATIALLLADYCPSVLNPSIRPLPPVLRSKFWLAVHVITIMLSYAAFAVALGTSNVTLAYCLAGSTNRAAAERVMGQFRVGGRTRRLDRTRERRYMNTQGAGESDHESQPRQGGLR